MSGSENDLTNSAVPVKWVVAAFGWLVVTFGSVLAGVFWVGGYKADTDRKIETLQASDELQSAIIGRLPDRLTRMEMIICATDDTARSRACNRLGNQ